MNLRDFVDVTSRRNALEKELQLKLNHIGSYSLDDQIASSRNCENMVGAVQIPLGIAGPLRIQNSEFRIQNDYYLPLATTEGALVASVNRGCKAISQAGGVTVISQKAGITRAPVFTVNNLAEGRKFITWAEDNLPRLQKIAAATSHHLTLLKIKPFQLDRSVWLRFSFDTQDAMGMNMATIAATAIVEFIEKELQIKCLAVSGNMCVDKKPNLLNFIEGRGYSVWAEALIPDIIINEILKTDRTKILATAQKKLNQASILSGTIGANAQIANILSALFLATGQDLAHVSESSMGVTSLENSENGIYISVYLPDLPVGTVGGGTGLATQKEALSILSLHPEKEKNTAQKLAEIIGGAVLAGELSLLSSLSEGTLAKAHQKYARGHKPVIARSEE